jgi:hypothetical protein
MGSKGRALIEGLLAGGKVLLGHGPRCPATCMCRVVEGFAGVTVNALEGAAAKGKRAPRRAPVEREIAPTARALPRRPVEVVAVVVDAEVIEDSGALPPPTKPRRLSRGR